MDVGTIEEIEEEIPNTLFKESYLTACDICGEAFEKYWDEQEEEWMLRNAFPTSNVL